jgi:cytosine/adenosine deaminase-related metal-dependent hydrolase
MRLNNVYQIGDSKAGSICINDGKISDGKDERPGALRLMFDKAIVFPGLTNSHDHLDFNLFPQLGSLVYKNYTEWGNYIHDTYQQAIAQVMAVPVGLRTEWGLYKNLLAGVTTVVNHGDKLPVKDAFINVIDDGQSLHSVQFEKQWKRKLNNPAKRNIPVTIHTGEGTDKAAADEINQLLRWNIWGRELIGIHGVAMTAKQARRFKALVWCPHSNYYLLGATAKINELKKQVPILFGTDSTLTGDWNIWQHIRQARETGLLTDEELLDSLTTVPATIWGTNSGKLVPGYDGDMVIARLKNEQDRTAGFFSLNPADLLLVLHKGQVKLFDEMLFSQLNTINKGYFSKVQVGGAYKYVYGNLPGLMQQIRQYYPEAHFPVIN